MKLSLCPSYDSRETGDRYWVTTEIDDKVVEWRRPMPDPFMRHTVHIEVRFFEWLRWPRRRFSVTVLVGADKELTDDVLELDDNALVPGRTRREQFHHEINKALRDLGA